MTNNYYLFTIMKKIFYLLQLTVANYMIFLSFLLKYYEIKKVSITFGH